MMAEEEGYFERLAREIGDARDQAAIRELQRRIDKGEFPDNDDTVKAFAAGFYTAYAYKREIKQLQNGPSENWRMGSMLMLILGLLLMTFYAFITYHGVPMRPTAWIGGLVGIALLIGSYVLGKRSKRKAGQEAAEFNNKWGKK